MSFITGNIPGESNTGSNVGAGDGVFKQKNGVDLEFKSLVAGSNITLTAGADEITIDASGGGGGATQFEAFPYTTDFTLYNPANLTLNTSITSGWPIATGFVVYSRQEITSFSIIINALAGNTTARYNCAIYKYDYVNKVYDLIVENPSEFDTSSTGVTGLNTITLPIPVVLDAGFYIMVRVGNSSSGASIKSANQFTPYFGFDTNGTRINNLLRIAGGYKAPGSWPIQLAKSYWNLNNSTAQPRILINY